MQKVEGSSPFIRLGFPLFRATLVPQTSGEEIDGRTLVGGACTS